MKLNIAIGLIALAALLGMNHLYTKEVERHYQYNKDIVGLYCWPFVPSKMIK